MAIHGDRSSSDELHKDHGGLLSALSGACTSGNGHSQIRVDTTLVYVQPAGSWHDFPQVQDSNRTLRDGSLLPDPTAPICTSEALPDTQNWPRSSNILPGNKRITLSIRLPQTLLPTSVPGRWEQPRSPSSRAFPGSFTVRIGPERGYPSSRFGGGEVRQLQLHECRLPTPNGPIEIASFVVQWSGFPMYYVAARVPFMPDSAMLVLAEGHDSLTQAEFVAALQKPLF